MRARPGGRAGDLEHLIEQHGIEHVVETFSTAPSEVLLREIERCEQLGVSVSLVPRLFEHMTERLTVDHLGGLPLLSAQRVDPKGLQFALKYTVDRIVAGLLLLVLLPLFGLLVLGALLSVGRPIFFYAVDLLGNLQEWVDACETTAAAPGDDKCKTVGGIWYFGSSYSDCDFWDLASGAGVPRNAEQKHIGFRCCAD